MRSSDQGEKIMGFEFYKVRERARRVPEAVITEQGRIRFNKPAVDKFFHGGIPERVYLAFDRATGRIGVLPTEDDNKATFEVKHLGSGDMSIPSKAFFKRFEIDIPVGGISGIAIKLEPHNGKEMVVLEIERLKDQSVDE